MKRAELDAEADALALLQSSLAVSRETLGWLEAYVQELRTWQKRINLVASSTLGEIWSRHILDSAQFYAHAPSGARRWIDLGAGGGLPGIVLACQMKAARQGDIHLIESNNKKAAFLRHVAVTLDLPATIYSARIEAVDAALHATADVVTARALAPLDELLGHANPLLKTEGVCLFAKGREFELELTNAAKNWQFSADLLPSLTARDARIVRVTGLRRRNGSFGHS